MFYKLKKVFAGHIKVLDGPHVTGGPEVAQAWSRKKDFKNDLSPLCIAHV
jgi:hypothetical protein